MKKFLLAILVCYIQTAFATHNRAGEITYTYLGGRTYEVTITTYTRGSVQADRCTLELFWGDNSSSILNRVNGPQGSCFPARMGDNLGGDVQKNIYVGTHTYSNDGIYEVSFEDPNRNAGINNIPQSVSVPFFIKSELAVSSGITTNRSPILTNPPIDDGCLNRRFEHNPGAVDLDGDSLSFELVPTRGAGGATIPTTYDPNVVQDEVRIDSVNGDLYWDVPKNVGQFNFAIEIAEWRRNGAGQWVKIGYVIRDLQVNIDNCGNNPPVINPIGPFCVEAGTNLNFDVTANDPDGDPIELTAFGAPFRVINPADTFIANNGNPPVIGTFNWDAECNHVRQQPYFVSFQAKDDPSARMGENPLVDVMTTEIVVVAPAPRNPLADGGEGQIDLEWEESICKQAIGYKIYRREDSYGFVPSECETGVPAYTGYEFLDSTYSLGDTTYIDSIDLKRGVRYCYMVVACFPNGVESYASVEFCSDVALSAPLLTNVDVKSTDVTNGEIEVKWIFPPEVDSTNFPPPYSYKLYRSSGITGANFTEIQTLPNATDTFFTDGGLNTQDGGFNYKVEMYFGNPPAVLGESDPASSVFLTVLGADEQNILSANHNTPWTNNRYVIFRETLPGSTIFDSIGESFGPSFIDSNLVNGTEYCYRVLTIGAYTSINTLPSPLLNNSQISCSTPIDTTKPCTPEFTFDYNCVNDSIYFKILPPLDPDCIDDIISYQIYFKPLESDPWPNLPLLSLTNNVDSIALVGEPITGCWAITATDDAGNDPNGQSNESEYSEILCIESCPDIAFPNVFTPNGDGINDNFRPFSINDIETIDFQVFNRWGVLVFESKDVEKFTTIGWDGRDMNTGQLCSDGVYFYLCRFTPLNFRESMVEEINGFIHLFQNN